VWFDDGRVRIGERNALEESLEVVVEEVGYQSSFLVDVLRDSLHGPPPPYAKQTVSPVGFLRATVDGGPFLPGIDHFDILQDDLIITNITASDGIKQVTL
jgi:hypothetical protein